MSFKSSDRFRFTFLLYKTEIPNEHEQEDKRRLAMVKLSETELRLRDSCRGEEGRAGNKCDQHCKKEDEEVNTGFGQRREAQPAYARMYSVSGIILILYHIIYTFIISVFVRRRFGWMDGTTKDNCPLFFVCNDYSFSKFTFITTNTFVIFKKHFLHIY